MLLVAEKGKEAEISAVFDKWGLDAVTIGRVTNDGKLRVLEHGQVVAEIPNTALTDDAPVYQRPLERWEAKVAREMPAGVQFGTTADLTGNLKRLLGSENVCSKRWIHQQYDSMVQINTLSGPGGDAGVIRVKGTNRGLAMALDGNGRWCWLDPRLGAQHAVAEAARNVACTGATPLAATNCLNFGNPEKPHVMYQFSQVIDGMTEACEELEIPITGGNVSLYNETLGEGIYPTPVLGVVGVIDDVQRAMTSHFRATGRSILLLHAGIEPDATDAEAEFGSSEYARSVLGHVWGYPPSLELGREAALQKALIQMIGAGLIESAHDCADGGLAVALAESGFTAGLGATVDLSSELAAEFVLFGEDASRVVISCDPARVAGIQEVAQKYQISADFLGQTAPEKLEVKLNGSVVVSASIGELRDAWEHALERALHVETEERLVPNVVQRS
jgi:phosphoribosylformylglycinamidine synthase